MKLMGASSEDVASKGSFAILEDDFKQWRKEIMAPLARQIKEQEGRSLPEYGIVKGQLSCLCSHALFE